MELRLDNIKLQDLGLDDPKLDLFEQAQMLAALPMDKLSKPPLYLLLASFKLLILGQNKAILFEE